MLSIRTLWLDMKSVLRSTRQMINGALAPLNLSGAEGDILFHLMTGSDSFRQERLAELLDIGKAAISRTIDALESKGYVSRVRRKDDQRAYSVCLTDEGFSVGVSVVRIYERLYALVRKSISDEELEGIQSLLSRLAANLQSVEDASCCLNS